MIEAFESLQDEHLNGHSLSQLPEEPVLIQCSACGIEGIQGKQIIFDLKLVRWQCKESWPCEGDAARNAQTVKRIEELELEVIA